MRVKTKLTFQHSLPWVPLSTYVCLPKVSNVPDSFYPQRLFFAIPSDQNTISLHLCVTQVGSQIAPSQRRCPCPSYLK